MIARIIKNKFNKLEPKPEFSKIRIIFYRLVDPVPDMVEGEVWRVEPVEDPQPTGKQDKRGVPIYVQKVRPVERYIVEDTPRYHNGIWVIRRRCGDVELPTLQEKGTTEVWVNPVNLEVVLYSVCKGYKEVVNRVPAKTIKEGKIPAWVTDKAKEEVLMTLKEREEKFLLLSQGGPLPCDLLREFVLNGVQIIWIHPDAYVPDHRMPFYGHEDSVFQVGKFRYSLNFTELDEDYFSYADEFPSSGGPISDTELKKAMIHIASFAVSPEDRKSVRFLGVEPLPKSVYLINEEKSVSMTVDSMGKSTVHQNLSPEEVDQISQEYKEKVSQMLKSYTPKTLEYTFQDLIKVTYTSSLQHHVGVKTEVEEGIGKKDATTYFYEKVVAQVKEVWTANVYISPDVHPTVAKAVEMATKTQS